MPGQLMWTVSQQYMNLEFSVYGSHECDGMIETH